MNSIMKFLLENMLLRWLICFANSTTVITDLTTVINNLSAAQQARAIGPNGPLMDLTGNLKLCVLKFQEAAGLLNYILSGNMTGSPEGGSAALLQSGDSNASTTYTLAVNVLNDLQ